MKKRFCILILGLCLTGCVQKKDDPAKIAWGFLHAYYTNDYEGALQYADEETYADLSDALEQMRADGVTNEDMKSAARPVIIEVEGIIANDGYQAVCAYKLKNSQNDYSAMMETLLLNKTEEGWKAAF